MIFIKSHDESFTKLINAIKNNVRKKKNEKYNKNKLQE